MSTENAPTPPPARKKYVRAVGPRLRVLLLCIFGVVALLGANSVYLASITFLGWFKGLSSGQPVSYEVASAKSTRGRRSTTPSSIHSGPGTNLALNRSSPWAVPPRGAVETGERRYELRGRLPGQHSRLPCRDPLKVLSGRSVGRRSGSRGGSMAV